MTSNTDEFDQDQFDDGDFHGDNAETSSSKVGFFEALRTKPLYKLLAIMAGVGVALALALGVFSEDKAPPVSSLGQTPTIQEAPGGAATPFFLDQNKQANEQRATEALSKGGSSLPTPVGHDVTELVDKNKKDPLVEFREETERLKREMRNEQQQSNQKIQLMQQQMAQGRQQQAEDDSLAQAMQKQMGQLMESWTPRGGKVVNGYAKPVTEEDVAKQRAEEVAQFQQATAQQQQQSQAEQDKILVPSGTVNYAQLLMEANSDIPGPILAQILSGPLAGGRAIGRFEVRNDYLVMSFSLVSLKGKEYGINALALDPDTTLGGMATEVDHRYFSRVLLPAAGAFISAFGDALSETDTSTTVSDGAVLQDQAKKGSKEAVYAGLGKAGEKISDFFDDQANRIQTLVRVAVGTPMGLFFLSPVMKSGTVQQNEVTTSLKQQQANGNQTGPYSKTNNPYQGMGLSDSQSQMMQNMMTMMKSAGSETTTTSPTYTTRR